MNKLSYETLIHSPYSPDSLTDCHFFKYLDHFMCGKCFRTDNLVKNAFDELIVSRIPDFLANEINKLYLVGINVLFLKAIFRSIKFDVEKVVTF